MWKENEYEESTISKIFKRVTNNHSFSQSQQQTQAMKIPRGWDQSINLLNVAGSTEKLRAIPRSYKIRPSFSVNTLRKLLCEPKYRVATKGKSNIIFETDCSNCEAVYFDEFKRYFKLRSDETNNLLRIAIVKTWNCNRMLGSRSQL